MITIDENINPSLIEKAYHNIESGPSLQYLKNAIAFGYLNDYYYNPTDVRGSPHHVSGVGYDKKNKPTYTGWEKDGNYQYHKGTVCINSTKDYPGDYYSFVIAESQELRIVDEISKNTYPVFKVTDIKAPSKRIKLLQAIAQTLIDDPDNILQYIPSPVPTSITVQESEYIKCSGVTA
jgi:hypothetical protein